LSIQDTDGYTALHLSIKSSEKLKNCRPTRALLYRGANKEIADKKGNKPIDIASTLASITLKDELIGYLSQRRGFLDCLMLKTPLRKMEKSKFLPSIFLSLNLVAYSALVLVIFPIVENFILAKISIVVQILVMTFWSLASFKDPGFIKKPTEVDFVELINLIDPVQICPDCEIVRTPRSRHCGTCN